MHVRDFDTATDIRAVAALFGQLGYPTDDATLLGRADAGARDPATRVFVAEADGRVAGVLAIHVLAPWHVATRWALVSALVVDESTRGGGTGAALLAAAEAHARAAGCSHVELSSNERRLRAHAFYEREGYAEKRKRFVKHLAEPSTGPA
ncbi:MAG: GNAT family N-acetyltransferase [Burkholderiaceae bacterium]